MAKDAIQEQEQPKADNSQKLSLCAEVAIDRLFIDFDALSLNDLVVFASDICLRTAAIIKNNCTGETDQEKTVNALNLIAKVSVDTVVPQESGVVEPEVIEPEVIEPKGHRALSHKV